MFKLLAVVYGNALPNSTLRQAVLAYAAEKSSNPRFHDRAHVCRDKSISILNKRLGPIPTVDETDYFAVYFLARETDSYIDCSTHLQGALALYQYLRSNSAGNFGSL